MKLPLISNVTGLNILNIQYSARNKKYMHCTTIGLKKREKGTKPQAKTAVSYNKRPVCKHLLQGNAVFANTQYKSDFILYFIYISLAWEGIKTVKWNKGTPQGQKHLIGSRAVKQATEKLPKSERFYKLECDISRGIELTQCPMDFVLKQNFFPLKKRKKKNKTLSILLSIRPPRKNICK